jgi:hypothetical protein
MLPRFFKSLNINLAELANLVAARRCVGLFLLVTFSICMKFAVQTLWQLWQFV